MTDERPHDVHSTAGEDLEVREPERILDPSNLDIEIKVNGVTIPIGTFFKLAEASDGVAFKKSKVLFYKCNDASAKFISSITAEKLLGLRNGFMSVKNTVSGVDGDLLLHRIQELKRISDEGYKHALDFAANENRYCYEKISQAKKHFEAGYVKQLASIKGAVTKATQRATINQVNADLDSLIGNTALN